jgi:serine/tyrosine/threonine adenylyltransferase
MRHRPSTTHRDLGPRFYDSVEPARFPQAVLRHRNRSWAARVGLDDLTDEQWVAHFARFEPLPGSLNRPLALRYHGHQFRVYNPDLGDGRGFLFAQLHDLVDGRLLDLGTKGSGKTPWSRGGDGRLTLKGGVREVLATSLLEALGVYTSKSFSLIETGEQLQRNDEPSPTRSAVLVRLSHSHIRIGTFQRFAQLEDNDAIEILIAHTIRHYMPDLWSDDSAVRAERFFRRVAENCARLAASWMAAGFVHGVLNTDNINVTGESFDYGPWRFLPVFEPGFTAAYFDQGGLYAYGRQPVTLNWNLARLAECLLPFVPLEKLQPVLDGFQDLYQPALADAVFRRLGLAGGTVEHGRAIFDFLRESKQPFERFFYDAYGTGSVPGFDLHLAVRPGVNRDHEYFRRGRPCTMLIEEVEALWAPIAERDDWSAFEAKLADIALMAEAYRLPA